MDEEIRFAVALNEILRLRALEHGVKMGSFSDPAKHADVKRVDEAIEGRDGEFIDPWRAALAGRQADPDLGPRIRLRLRERLPGHSHESGLARFLDYRGIDSDRPRTSQTPDDGSPASTSRSGTSRASGIRTARSTT